MMETKPKPERPEFSGVFNKEYLLNTFENNEKSVKSLLAVLLERTAGQVEGMADLIENRNWAEMNRVAHIIRGSVTTLSGMELGQAAGRIENAYRQNNPEEMAAGFPLVVEAFQRFKAAAEEYIQP